LARKYNLKAKRSWVTSRLYALSNAEKLTRVKGKKGLYKRKQS